MKFLIVILLFLFAQSVSAQMIGNLLSPRQPVSSLSSQHHFFQDFSQYQVSASQNLYSNNLQRLSFSGTWEEVAFEDPHTPRLQKAEAGLNYTLKHTETSESSLGIMYGSASDDIFSSSDVSTLSINLLHKRSPKWYFLVNYSNNRSFLNNIPIPSFLYVHTLSRERTIVFGVPFFFLRSNINESLSLQYSSLMPYIHRLSLQYRPSFLFSFSLEANQLVETFIPKIRENKDERYYLLKRQVLASINFHLKRSLSAKLQFGHQFDSRFFMSEGFRDNRSMTRKLDDNFFTSLSFQLQTF